MYFFFLVAILFHLLLVCFVINNTSPASCASMHGKLLEADPEHICNWIERAVVGLQTEAWLLSET